MAVIITSQTRIEVSNTDNLLEVLLNSGHDINYQCREGYCGGCRVKTAQTANVSYNEPPLAMIADNEILPCCCQVNGDLKLAC